GHSVGEIVAACVAGVFSLPDALKLIAARGRLMNGLPQDGAMVSLLTDEVRVQQAIAEYRKEVSIAAVNGPESVVIAGKREAVLAIAEQFAAAGVKTRQLAVSHAFHSPLMEPMLDDFAQIAQSITYHPPQIPIVSNVTGQLSTDALSTVSLSNWQYWVRHVRETVRFADGMTTLFAQGVNILLEIGPKPTLLGMVDRRGFQSSVSSLQFPVMLPSLRENRSDWQQMVESLGALYIRGVEVDWRRFEQVDQVESTRKRVPLPTYPFQRQRYWLRQPAARQQQSRLRPQIDTMIKLPAQRQIVFEAKCGVATQPYVVDHRVHDVIVISGAAHISMVLTGVDLAYGDQPCVLQNIAFLHALTLTGNEIRTVQVIFDEAESGSLIDFQVLSYNETVSDAPLLHATGKLSIGTAAAPSTLPLADLQQCCTEPVDPATVVNILAEQVRVDLGPSYLWGDAFWRGETGVLSKLRLPATEHSIEGYPLFPGLFDACMQGIIAYHADKVLEPAVPFAIDTFTFYGGADSGGSDLRELWCYAEAAADDRWHLHLADARGRTILRCEGLLRRAFPQSAALSQQMQRQWLYQMAWQPAPLPTIQPTATEEPRLWFLIDNSPDTTVALQGALQTAGAQVVRILLDPSADPASFNIGSNGHLPATVHLNPQADYQPLFAALLDKAALHHPGQVMGCNVLYLCGDAAETEGDSLTPDQLPAHTLQLAGSLLHTVRALSHSGLDARLWIVTQGCQEVTCAVTEGQAGITQSVELLAAQGALWGLGRTIAHEYPQLQCTCIDLAPTAAPTEMAAQIMCECRQPIQRTAVESQLAYRAGERYVARLLSVRPPENSTTCEPDASYLITGGLGALGLQSAQMLVEAGARHLTLASRHTELDAPAQAAIAAWEEQGATIQVVAADVANGTDVMALLAACAARAPLRGIIHAAGTVDDGILEQQSWDRFAAVMRAKVDGTWQLHRATHGLPLDFFVCFSSVSALFGNQGQGNYAAANAFMDAL
ncbi:MAG: SDR family NAD(P)-dependent oxidoreductase, partial [Caldilineaceae bacterium]|nr:SDR family NAD(P)-dependent oxidoreductase [Caldilineaceae bacterium]